MGANNSVVPAPPPTAPAGTFHQCTRPKRTSQKKAVQRQSKVSHPGPQVDLVRRSLPRSVSPSRRPVGFWSFDTSGLQTPWRQSPGDASSPVENNLAFHWDTAAVVEVPAGSAPADPAATARLLPTALESGRQPAAQPTTPLDHAPAATEDTPGPTAQALLDRRGLLRLYIAGLEDLNRQSRGRLAAIYAPGRLPLPEEFGEAMDLKAELGSRSQYLGGLAHVLGDVDAHLAKLGVDPLVYSFCADGSESTRDACDTDDFDTCQFCLSKPIATQYPCCQYRGACEGCAATIRNLSGRCPHCRNALAPC